MGGRQWQRKHRDYPENLQEEQRQRQRLGRGASAQPAGKGSWRLSPVGPFLGTLRGLPTAPRGSRRCSSPSARPRGWWGCGSLVVGPWLPPGCVPRLEELSSSRVPPGHFVAGSRQPCGTLGTPPAAPALAGEVFHMLLPCSGVPLFPWSRGRALCPPQTPQEGTGAPPGAQVRP